jgi:multiple sugar transport system ATP-binding protein
MVFQDYALYPHMTVFENMAFGLVMRRMPRAETERRVRDAAAMLGLNALLARRPRELSGGQRQRVALGRAIVRQPAVFLFDEPLSNLDAALRIEMRAELSRLHDRLQTTSVFVTHDQVEAMTMGSKIVVMRDGRIQQVGPPLGVYHAPANRFVAGFIGSPRMNFLDGAVIEDAKGVGVLCGGLRIPLPGGDDAAWRSQIGRAVTLGLRPGDIHEPRSGEGPDAWRVEAEAVVVEPLGPETHVHARIDRHELVAVLGPTVYVRPHDRIPLVLELGRMHVFAVDGEQERILPTGRRDSRAA